jgi:hypothetical protein
VARCAAVKAVGALLERFPKLQMANHGAEVSTLADVLD